MGKRKGISKQKRFEIFKRDTFTCQYCGRKAPDVILEIDHIEPVSAGGNNGMLNLITSCFDCNRGKSDRSLSNQEMLNKKRNQLEIANERVEQMKMMLKWQDELSAAKNMELDYIITYWKTAVIDSSCETTKQMVSELKLLLKQFGLSLLLEGIDISVSQYCYKINKNQILPSEFHKAFSKISGVCYNKKHNKYFRELKYLCGIVKRRCSYFNERSAENILRDVLNSGYTFEAVRDIVGKCNYWNEFTGEMSFLLEEN